MTDTIGFGDVEVDSRHRRLPHLPRWVVWPAAAAVLTVVVLVPRVESHLAGDAAAWLQGQWSLATAYDAARQSTQAQAGEHAARADRQLLTDLVSAADDEEARRLEQIADDVRRHRSWSGDVHHAQTAVLSALAAEAHDLRAGAAKPAVFFSGSYYSPSNVSDDTRRLEDTAGRLVAVCAQRHHVHAPSPGRVQLTAAGALLRRLERTTDEPVPLRLAVEGDAGLDIWNLMTGRVEQQIDKVHLADGFITPRRVGASLLVEPAGHWLLVPPGGSRPIRLPAADQYLPAADGAVWSVSDATVRRLDDRGRPAGGRYALPTGYDLPFGASADSLLLARRIDPYDEASPPVSWTPRSGRIVPLTGACDANAVATGHVVAYLPCNLAGYIAVLDTRTGVVRRLRMPHRLLATIDVLLLSPDGRRLATEVTRSEGADPTQSTLAVVDVASGAVTLLPAGAPLAWSADGSVLVIDADVDPTPGTSSTEPLAYWTVGSSRLAPIRISILDNVVVAALPP